MIMNKDAPWVWFDVDDVVVDASPLFQESMDRWTGQVIPWQTWPDNHFPPLYGIQDDDEEGHARMKDVWRADRILERAPVRPGVRAVMHQIKEAGCRIGLITARGWHEDGEGITRRMVKANGLPVSQVLSVFYNQSKAAILQATDTQVVAVLDDTPRHIAGCVAAGLPGWLLDQPWNVQATHLPRMASLEAFARHVQQVMAPQPPRRRLRG